jgi:hypothetical protein
MAAHFPHTSIVLYSHSRSPRKIWYNGTGSTNERTHTRARAVAQASMKQTRNAKPKP